MDTKDTNPDLASSGVVAPDSGVVPLETEVLISTEQQNGVELPNGAGGEPPLEVADKEASTQQKKAATPLQDSLRRLRRDSRKAAGKFEESRAELAKNFGRQPALGAACASFVGRAVV